MDVTRVYRLTNSYLGPDVTLAARAADLRLEMMPAADDPRQYWQVVNRGGGRLTLVNVAAGDALALGYDGVSAPVLDQTADVPGQHWRFAFHADGTLKMANEAAGLDRWLNVFAGSNEVSLGPGDFSGQHWNATALGPVARPVHVPPLDPGGAVEQTEGPGDYERFVRPLGRVKAVMVFVDFPDAPAGATSAAATADHLLGGGRAQTLYHEQSYGRMTLDVTVRADLGWRQVPHASTCYVLTDFFKQRTFIQDSAALFRPNEVRFSDYRVVLVVAARSAQGDGFAKSPAFTPLAGDEANSPSGGIRSAVTFGRDSYANSYINLVHELGHVIALPDEYPEGGGANNTAIGCWSLMSDIWHSVSFLGWHRHKNGWLDPAKITYLARDTVKQSLTLAPLGTSSGLSTVVIPVDNAQHPSKVLVLEPAQRVVGSDGSFAGSGVLAYTVDATIASGHQPVVLVARSSAPSDVYGAMFEAPFGVGDSSGLRRLGRLKVQFDVVEQFHTSYRIVLSHSHV
jgi:M6 family metalloprotease-like protein